MTNLYFTIGGDLLLHVLAGLIIGWIFASLKTKKKKKTLITFRYLQTLVIIGLAPNNQRT